MPNPTAGTAAADSGSNAGGKSFDQAFNEAVEEHAGSESAGGDGDTTAEGSQPSEDTQEGGRSDEASEGDEAKGKGAEDEAAEGAEGGEGATEEEAALIAQLPPALRSQWNRVFTQKSQAIAADARLIRALKANPEAAAKRILEKIEEGRKSPSGEGSESESAAAKPPTKSSLVERFSKIPGVNKQQAEALADIHLETLEAVVAPLRTTLEQRDEEARMAEIDTALDGFKKDHPEFDEIEADMAALMDELPQGNIPHRRYLDHIHQLVMGDKAVATRVKKILDKQTANAKTATTKAKSVPGAAVRSGRADGKPATFDEAAEAALRGEVWGRGIHR